jgi:hypothetical protein
MIKVPIRFRFFNNTDNDYYTPFVLSTTVGRILEQSVNNRFAAFYGAPPNAYELLADSIDNSVWIDVPFDEKEIYRGALGLAIGKHVIIDITAYHNNTWALSMHGISMYFTDSALSKVLQAQNGFKMNVDLLDRFDIFDTVAQIISTYNKGDTMHTPEGKEQYPGLKHVKRHNVIRKPIVSSYAEEGKVAETLYSDDDTEMENAIGDDTQDMDMNKCIPMYRAAALAVSRIDVRSIIDTLYAGDPSIPSKEEREVMISILTDNLMSSVMEFCDRVKSQLAIGETAITLKRFMVYLRDEKRAEFVCFLEPGPRFSLMFTPIGYSLSLSND